MEEKIFEFDAKLMKRTQIISIAVNAAVTLVLFVLTALLVQTILFEVMLVLFVFESVFLFMGTVRFITYCRYTVEKIVLSSGNVITVNGREYVSSVDNDILLMFSTDFKFYGMNNIIGVTMRIVERDRITRKTTSRTYWFGPNRCREQSVKRNEFREAFKAWCDRENRIEDGEAVARATSEGRREISFSRSAIRQVVVNNVVFMLITGVFCLTLDFLTFRGGALDMIMLCIPLFFIIYSVLLIIFYLAEIRKLAGKIVVDDEGITVNEDRYLFDDGLSTDITPERTTKNTSVGPSFSGTYLTVSCKGDTKRYYLGQMNNVECIKSRRMLRIVLDEVMNKRNGG